MRSTVFAAMLILVITCSPAMAQSNGENMRWAANNTSHDCIVCSVFFHATAECVRREPNRAALAADYASIGDRLALAAIEYAALAGIKQNTINARIDMAKQDVQQKTDSSCANFSVLIAEYARQCNHLAKDPKAIFYYCLGQASRQ